MAFQKFMDKFVDIETPYSASTKEELQRNIRYARACVRDSLSRGEFPFASHLFFTQPGILDDNIPEERRRGIMVGKAIIEKLSAVTVVYTDLGISNGMRLGIDMAREAERNIVYRSLGERWDKDFSTHENNHSHQRAW